MSWKMPLVSFLMPTYGRASRQPELISEAVYWFTRQDYPNCELVILNDAKDQELICSVPNVIVYNTTSKFPTLGSKMNALVELAMGDVCLVCEDDDISMPWRASQAVTHIGKHDYFAPRYWWYEEKGRKAVADSAGVGHNCSAFRHPRLAGKGPVYSNDVTNGHDAVAHQKLMHGDASPVQLYHTHQISYVYRFGWSDLHLSAQQNPDQVYLENDPGPAGVYRIEPKMGFNYALLSS